MPAPTPDAPMTRREYRATLSHDDLAQLARDYGDSSYLKDGELWCAEHPGEEIDSRYGCRVCPLDDFR